METQIVASLLPRIPRLLRSIRGLQREECEGSARVALVEAVRSFDPKLEVPIERWVDIRMRGAIKDQQRRWGNVGKRAYRSGEQIVPRYIVTGEITISVHTEVEAPNKSQALLRATDLPMMTLCHQCSSEMARDQWITSGELDGEPQNLIVEKLA